MDKELLEEVAASMLHTMADIADMDSRAEWLATTGEDEVSLRVVYDGSTPRLVATDAQGHDIPLCVSVTPA